MAGFLFKYLVEIGTDTQLQIMVHHQPDAGLYNIQPVYFGLVDGIAQYDVSGPVQYS